MFFELGLVISEYILSRVLAVLMVDGIPIGSVDEFEYWEVFETVDGLVTYVVSCKYILHLKVHNLFIGQKKMISKKIKTQRFIFRENFVL